MRLDAATLDRLEDAVRGSSYHPHGQEDLHWVGWPAGVKPGEVLALIDEVRRLRSTWVQPSLFAAVPS